MAAIHKVKIYYHDTDCGGVVYYANYLKYMEEARTEFFEQREISLKSLAAEKILFVVARQEVEYKAPAVYADILEVETRFSDVSAVKMVAEHRITNQEKKVICLGKTTLVCVDHEIKPRVIPAFVKEKLLD